MSTSAAARPVWVSGLAPPDTGVGVFQRHVYRRLTEKGIPIVVPPRPENRVLRAVDALGRVVRQDHAGALICTTPAPLAVRVPYVAVVYDLRWRRTRGPAAQAYRHLDLRRTVTGAAHVFTISGRTRDDLVERFPGVAGKCSVLHLGPGSIAAEDFTEGEPGAVLLVGRTPHKRNELVARALAEARPDWARRYLLVGVTDPTYETLVDAFGAGACERFDRIDDDELRSTFRRADVYLSASLEEGFGLPMVEALAAGCQVIAIRQPLTVEILGDAGVLLDDGDGSALASQLASPSWVSPQVRRARARLFSWDAAAEAVATALRRATDPKVPGPK